MNTTQTRALAVATMAALAILALAAPACSMPASACGSDLPSRPYLVFHLDAISSAAFFEMLDAGLLPNISALFSDGVTIPYAVSPFLPGTEMVYPRMKRGTPASSDDPIGWETINRSTGERRTYTENVLGLWQWLPRYALSEATIGVVCRPVTALSIVNTRRMLRDFDVVEFFWFATDAIGHTKGIEGQKLSVAQFDAMLRPVVEYVRSAPGSVNLVLYCDHGMSMIEEFVDIDRAMTDVAGERAVLCYYPNLYLTDPMYAPEIAQALAARREVDFAFWREGDSRMVGAYDSGTVVLDYEEDRISYIHEGEDPFGYYDLGYRGEPLTDSEWLSLTCRSPWPAVPVQIVRYMQAEQSGHVVVISNPPKGIPTIGRYIALHKGLAALDCTVPVLMSGPDILLEPVPESIWLHTLYSEVLGVDPLAARRPLREPDSLTLSATGARLTLSPSPSLLLHAEASSDASVFLCETDLFRSFNTRIWIGAGVASHGRGTMTALLPVFSTRLEVFADRLVIDCTSLRSAGKPERRLSARYEAESGFTLRWSFPFEIGLGLTW
ncbi:MAG: hypothetical protein KBB15_05470 [Firmicutes bacterium]|nr:hypothetical protein [Bacillota bacterium]